MSKLQKYLKNTSRKPVESNVQGFSHVCPECGAGLDGRKGYRRNHCTICEIEIDWTGFSYSKDSKKVNNAKWKRTLG